ncbi:serine hydrolase domain-containing protein [Pseudooceanicola sp. 200-1SW]|uniref:serine hydrolase domain-containing protein n=1 Tax=Pseudooceanicola sp. 200-1SW TaxID=3425949 RepID=UPI003D7F7AD7
MTTLHAHWITEAGAEGNAGAPGALFPYWSFSKTVLAVLALQQAAEAALCLDDALPGRPFTLRQLLGHRAGLPDYGPLAAYHAAVARGDPPWPRDRLEAETLAQGHPYAPGAGWLYSNLGYLYLREWIEATAGAPLADLVQARIRAPLGLDSVTVWDRPEQGAALHWPAARAYHPHWVYHRSLIGTARDAARLLAGLAQGALLDSAALAQMRQITPLGGPLPGRPWASCGYGLGLMAGTVAGLGRVFGHSGAGPFCVNAVYHFPDLACPVTLACFTDAPDEGRAEQAVVDIARALAEGRK